MLIDYINGFFEFASAFFVLNNCRMVMKHKDVAGVSIITICFFTLWGFWNVFYYPQLEQTYSFYGGIAISMANIFWVYLLIKYRRK